MDPNAEPATSRFTVTIVIVFLGLTVLVSLVGAIALTAASKHTPEQMWTFGTTALGALAAMLVSTRVANPVPAKEINALPPVPPPAVTTTTTTEVHAPDAVVTGPITDDAVHPQGP